MSIANPYAAPQSIECALDLRKLPTATLASSGMLRRALPVVSTRELARLVKQSRALDDMQVVWMWLTPVLIGVVFALLWLIDFEGIENINFRPLASGVGVCLTRLVFGHGRSTVGRWFCLLLDFLLVAACVVALTWLSQRWFFGSFIEQVTWVLCTAILYLPASFGFHALVAMLEARVLFGSQRCRPRELLDEYDYRRELGIE